jgi:hypothetical protein
VILCYICLSDIYFFNLLNLHLFNIVGNFRTWKMSWFCFCFCLRTHSRPLECMGIWFSGAHHGRQSHVLRMHWIQGCPVDAGFIFPIMLPSRRPQIFTWSLQLSTFTFILLFVHHLLFGRHTTFSRNYMQGTLSRSCNNFNTADDNAELTKSFSASTELWSVWGNLIFLVLKTKKA